MKMKISILKVLLILTSAAIVGLLGFFVGSEFQRQTLYQSHGFHVENTLSALENIHRGDIPATTASLEISLAAGIVMLPKEDALMTNQSKWYVSRALVGAKCYGEKYSWKNLSPATAQVVESALKAKLLDDNKCL